MNLDIVWYYLIWFLVVWIVDFRTLFFFFLFGEGIEHVFNERHALQLRSSILGLNIKVISDN
jgi:hypothetical protein